MYEFLTEHSLFIVLTIALIIWAGIMTYLLRMDKRISKLEEHRSVETKKQ
jgi:CcmD family protein